MCTDAAALPKHIVQFGDAPQTKTPQSPHISTSKDCNITAPVMMQLELHRPNNIITYHLPQVQHFRSELAAATIPLQRPGLRTARCSINAVALIL
jgi:hypothetical protein